MFIDELHTVVGAGAAEGAMDAGEHAQAGLARGELHVIGATTLDEYRKNIEKDPALERRFQPVLVGEPTVEETIEILHGLKDRYEAHPPRADLRRGDRRRRRALRPLHPRPLPAGQGDRPDRPGRRARAPADEDEGRRHARRWRRTCGGSRASATRRRGRGLRAGERAQRRRSPSRAGELDERRAGRQRAPRGRRPRTSPRSSPGRPASRSRS